MASGGEHPGAPPTPRARGRARGGPAVRVSRRFRGPLRAGLRLRRRGGEAGKRRAGETGEKPRKAPAGARVREKNYTVPSPGTQVPSPQSGSGFLPSGRRPAGGQDGRFGGCVPHPPSEPQGGETAGFAFREPAVPLVSTPRAGTRTRTGERYHQRLDLCLSSCSSPFLAFLLPFSLLVNSIVLIYHIIWKAFE